MGRLEGGSNSVNCRSQAKPSQAKQQISATASNEVCGCTVTAIAPVARKKRAAHVCVVVVQALFVCRKREGEGDNTVWCIRHPFQKFLWRSKTLSFCMCFFGVIFFLSLLFCGFEHIV